MLKIKLPSHHYQVKDDRIFMGIISHFDSNKDVVYKREQYSILLAGMKRKMLSLDMGDSENIKKLNAKITLVEAKLKTLTQ